MDGVVLPGRAVLVSGRALQRGLAISGVMAVGVMLWGARAGQAGLVTWAAALFAASAAVVAVVCLTQAWRWPDVAGRAPLMPAYVALLQSTRFAALCYGWGAVAMQGLYLTPVTGLKWQHAWQYAAAMALLALATLAFGRSMPQPLPGGDVVGFQRHARWVAPLAGAQVLVAGAGLAALAVSGKLWSERTDWAANRVFAALAVAILAIELTGLVSHWRLTRASSRV